MALGSFQCRNRPSKDSRFQLLSLFFFFSLLDSKDCILEPLSLPGSPGGPTTAEGPSRVPCIFCEEHVPVAEQDQLLKHMIIEHKMVIADVRLVADFQRYVVFL